MPVGFPPPVPTSPFRFPENLKTDFPSNLHSRFISKGEIATMRAQGAPNASNIHQGNRTLGNAGSVLLRVCAKQLQWGSHPSNYWSKAASNQSLHRIASDLGKWSARSPSSSPMPCATARQRLSSAKSKTLVGLDLAPLKNGVETATTSHPFGHPQVSLFSGRVSSRFPRTRRRSFMRSTKESHFLTAWCRS